MTPNDWERAVQDYRPLSHEAFVASLRGLPFREAKWMYRPVGDPTPWQGDVVLESRITLVSDSGDQASLYTGPAMLLSPGCDMEPDRVRFVSMAPVQPASLLTDPAPTPAKKAAARATLESNQVSTVMYLPAEVGLLPDAYVDFELRCPVPQAVARAVFARAGGRRVRLSDNGWRLLTAKYWYHTARDESRDDFPRT